MLDDLDWRAGQIVVDGKAHRRDPLPLPSDVGEAIAEHLRRRSPPARGAARVLDGACCGSVGLDIGSETTPYIASWGEDGELDAIREYAETIDTIARRIEGALDATSTTQTEHELADAA